MKVKLNKIPAPTVKLFSPKNGFLGHINEYEFNDIRVQIMKAKAEGYSVKDERGIIFKIDKYGRLGGDWPRCFDLMTEQLGQLI